jgi:phosphoribosyl 1,2-cyclic phosphodiesterase
MGLKVKFWGVRGSIATPSPRHISFGGNTSCLEVTADRYHVILDAGTGIRNLGKKLLQEGARDFHILLSHTHWDHMNGFPFFAPAYEPGCTITIMAGHLIDHGGIRKVFAGQMAQPMFPVPLEAMRSSLTFEDFRAGDSFALEGGIQVKTKPLNHPDGATGYRLEYGGTAVCYVTDTEHIPGKPDQNVLDLIEGADLVIYDSTYTDDEFPEKVGWGHSTWQEGMRLCRAANVKSFAVFHHDPDHEDEFMEQVETEIRSEWDGAFVAREGMEIDVG